MNFKIQEYVIENPESISNFLRNMLGSFWSLSGNMCWVFGTGFQKE